MKRIPLALVGCDAPKKTIEKLTALGFDICILEQDERLPLPVRSHADMLVFAVDDNIFCSAEYLKKAHAVFERIEKYGYKIIQCDTKLSDIYPHDISFNLALVGKHLFGKLDFTSQKIIDHAKKSEFTLVPVKQGYAKCSTVILGDTAIITADKTIASAAMQKGIRVLKIENSPSAVSLKGYDYGFIGGACGIYKNKVYFSGNIYRHPDGQRISDFCVENGFEPISLTDGPLVDIGGIIFLDRLN